MKKFGITAAVAAIIAIAGFVLKWKNKVVYSVGIIGGADGPTSIFVAGKVGNGAGILAVVAGIVILIAVAIFIWKKKR
ncbi:MAG: oxaloacetate decarboxylase [Lachnospiraceae bacterium]|nr:oxaloacetate decarboxylase [Lachnospiraceae bacterium]